VGHLGPVSLLDPPQSALKLTQLYTAVYKKTHFITIYRKETDVFIRDNTSLSLFFISVTGYRDITQPED